MNQIIIQGIGYIALLFWVLSFQNNKRERILLCIVIADVFFFIQFFLLHAYTGALLNGLAAIQQFVFYNRDLKKWANKQYWLYIFLFLYIVAGIITWENIYSILPTIGMVVGTIAVWNRNAKKIRLLMLVPRPLWFVYDIIVGSNAGALTEFLIFSSIIVGIVRFDILKRQH